ncbi:MAG: hypothetical protein QXU63_04970 [Nitrososphaerota archaeon]
MKMRKYLSTVTLIFLIILSLSTYSGYSTDWLKLEVSKVVLKTGGEATVKVDVGKDVVNRRVELLLLDLFPGINASISPSEGRTPYIAYIHISTQSNTTPGRYFIKIQATINKIVVEEEVLEIQILDEVLQAFFINKTCPAWVVVGEKVYVNLTFSYNFSTRSNVRVVVLLNDEVETLIEFTLVENGTVPLYRQITALQEPGTLILSAKIEYYNSLNASWVKLDEFYCQINVQPIATKIKLRVIGLPSNFIVSIQALVIPSGEIHEVEVRGGDEVEVQLSISQPSTVIVVAQNEVYESSDVKYVVEEGVREVLLKPGWVIRLQFKYSKWYLLTSFVEPDEDVLKIVEFKEWFKENSIIELTPPLFFHKNDTLYILSEIKIGNIIYDVGSIVILDSPYKIIYRYNKYYRVQVEFVPHNPLDEKTMKEIYNNMPAELSEILGVYWIRDKTRIEIPFREYLAGRYKFTPRNVESNLFFNISDGNIRLVISSPVFVKMHYNVYGLLRIVYDYEIEREVEERWIELGKNYTLNLHEILNPKIVGGKVELKSVDSLLDYKYIALSDEINIYVDSPGEVRLNLKRYYLVKIHQVKVGAESPPICNIILENINIPSMNEVTEFWLPEGTRIVCYFVDKIEKENSEYIFQRGWIGDVEFSEHGLKMIIVDKPLEISAEYLERRYYRLEGVTEKGYFIGGGVYPEGSIVEWRVEPSTVDEGGLMALLGFKWKPMNYSGVITMDRDRQIKIFWHLTPYIDSPLIVFLQLIAILLTTITAYRYHVEWKKIMRGESSRDEESS